MDGQDDYLHVVKENQPALREEIQTLFEQPQAVQETFHAAHSINLHGDRLEERHWVVSAALAGYTDWPGLHQVMRLERHTLNKQKQILRHEIAYGVTSLSPERASPDQLLKVWREHWHIENKLHYVRDVTFDEDRSQVRSEHIPSDGSISECYNCTLPSFGLDKHCCRVSAFRSATPIGSGGGRSQDLKMN